MGRLRRQGPEIGPNYDQLPVNRPVSEVRYSETWMKFTAMTAPVTAPEARPG